MDVLEKTIGLFRDFFEKHGKEILRNSPALRRGRARWLRAEELTLRFASPLISRSCNCSLRRRNYPFWSTE
jgi:hypothetical protein